MNMTWAVFELTSFFAAFALLALFANAAAPWREVDLTPQACLAFWKSAILSLTRAGYAELAGVFGNHSKKA